MAVSRVQDEKFDFRLNYVIQFVQEVPAGRGDVAVDSCRITPVARQHCSQCADAVAAAGAESDGKEE